VTWNVSNVGAVADEAAHAYGVSLAAVGLLTTALFLTHLAVQLPAGRACDRFGARRVGFAALAAVCAGNLLLLLTAGLAVSLGLLALPIPLPLVALAALVGGLAAGFPFAALFATAQRTVPDAPGAAVGFVNAWAILTILVGTPLVGATFSLPAGGRLGFGFLSAFSALTLLGIARVGATRED